MKVLWFTNTPCLASDFLKTNTYGGGWLKSLQKSIFNVKEVELSISFLLGDKMESFDIDQCIYYPIYVKAQKNKFHRLLNRYYNNENKTQNTVISQMIKIIQNVNPDIIHVHGTEECFGLIHNYTTIPVVISLQGIISPYTDFYYSGINPVDAAKGESLLDKILLKSQEFKFNSFNHKKQREKYILKNSKFIIGRTEWDERVSSILAPDAKYFTNNEIIRDVFYRNTWDKKRGDNFKIVTTTSDSLYKGFELIVQTCMKLKELNRFDFQWFVIGLSEDSNIVKIVNKIFNVDFEKTNIVFLGKQNDEDLIKVLLDSDLYCQVSHIENSPNSLCEAMLLGMPIISTYAGGTSSLISDLEGYIVQSGDSYAYAGTIWDCVKNYEKALYYASRAKAKARIRHNAAIIVNDLMKIYHTITNGSENDKS